MYHVSSFHYLAAALPNFYKDIPLPSSFYMYALFSTSARSTIGGTDQGTLMGTQGYGVVSRGGRPGVWSRWARPRLVLSVIISRLL